MLKAQVFAGASIGLLLGLLLGLSAAPAVALVVGALAALLGSVVLPAAQAKGLPAETAAAVAKAAAWRSTALGLACIAGLVAGLWMRTHDVLSPPAPSLARQLAELRDAGYPADEARRLVASRAFPAAERAASGAAPAAGLRSTVLFGQGSSACEQMAPSRYASVAAAGQAYAAAGDASLAALAHALAALPEEAQRAAVLKAAVAELCGAR